MEVAHRSVLQLTSARASGGLPDINKNMRVIRVAILAASLITVACLPARVPFSSIPLPPTAELATLEGPEEVPIDLTWAIFTTP